MCRRKKAKILVVGPTPPPYNGMSVVLENLFGSHLNEQFELTLLDIADRRGLKNMGRLDAPNLILALWHGLCFLWLLISKRPDIVYISPAQNTFGYLRDCLFLIPSRLLRRRVVIHLHGSYFQNFYQNSPMCMQILIRWTLRSIRKAIVLGESLRNIFAGLVPPEKISVVPNGIQSMDSNNSVKRVKSKDDLKRILYLGTLNKAKGFLEVLRSMPLVIQHEPNVHLTLAGEQCYPDKIQEANDFIARHQLGKYITMLGVVVREEKTRLLNDSDIFVFPPVAPEGQPLVILEAMAVGLPVIATPQGTIPETVIDGENGFIVPSQNPVVIAEKVLLLINDCRLRKRMGQASRDRFLKCYTLDRWARDMCAVFHSVLAER